VIPDQEDMDHVLRYLVFRMNTIDGRRGSSLPLQGVKSKLETKIVKHHLMMAAMSKYNILRIRMKISYHAFLKKHTISEHIMRQVVRSHECLLKENSIPIYDNNLKEK
jgi:hypothetical protein